MTPDEFRQHGYQVVDWIADYLADVRQRPVFPAVQPGAVTESLPTHGPEQPEPFDVILRDFDQLIAPNLTLWNHPRFFNFFSISSSPPGVLGEMLAAALNTNHMLWRSGQAATELEQVTLGWLREWMGLPPDWFGILHDTASLSTMHAIIAAREFVAPECRTEGSTPGLTLYVSAQAHSSVEKGAIAVGIGQQYVRKIDVDDQFAMRADLLQQAIEQDLAAGLRPFCVVPSVGTTSTTAIDPLPQVMDIAERHGLWVHVDAAYAGSAAICPEFRHFFAGAERAHSLVTNPHKWMLVPVDCSVLYTSRPDILRRAFSLVPAYLQTSESALNQMDYGVPLGRRFRALKLWFVMRAYGRERLAEIIRQHCRWAQDLARLAAADGRFRVVAPVPFSLVCLQHVDGDEPAQAIVNRLNASGRFFLGTTRLHGKLTIRIPIGNFMTTWEDVQALWAAISAPLSVSA